MLQMTRVCYYFQKTQKKHQKTQRSTSVCNSIVREVV